MFVIKIVKHSQIVTHLMSNDFCCFDSWTSLFIDRGFVSFPRVGSTEGSNPSNTNGSPHLRIFAKIDKEMGIGWTCSSDVLDGTTQGSRTRFSSPGLTFMIGVVTISLNLNFGAQGGMTIHGLDVSEDGVQVGSSSRCWSKISIESVIITYLDLQQVGLRQFCAWSSSATGFHLHFSSNLVSIFKLITINQFPFFIISEILWNS